jgi:hypothetical protein
MTSLRDDILAPVGRELSDHYLPTVQGPLPSELRDLVVRLVAFESCERASSARTSAASAVRYDTAGTGRWLG